MTVSRLLRTSASIAIPMALALVTACAQPSSNDNRSLTAPSGVALNSEAPPPPPPPPPPSEGGQGCTPGYWKQPHHAANWPAPYSPSTMFNDVFGVGFPGRTLDEVLGQGGGGLKALGRHTVAALLNGASTGVSYDLSDAQVIAAFRNAIASRDYETTKNRFAAFNEQGCPLGWRDASAGEPAPEEIAAS